MLAFSVTEAPSSPPVPVDPCLSEPCGAFSECSSQEGEALCSCLPGYIGEPPSCRPECVENSECPSTLACIEEKCRDLCPGTCGPGAQCEVISHTAVCTCQQGYIGDPYTTGGCTDPNECRTDGDCGASLVCIEAESGYKKCVDIFEILRDFFGEPGPRSSTTEANSTTNT